MKSIHFMFAYTEEGEEGRKRGALATQVFLLFVRSWERTRGVGGKEGGEFLDWGRRVLWFYSHYISCRKMRGEEEEAILEEGKRMMVLGSCFCFYCFYSLFFYGWLFFLLLHIVINYYFSLFIIFYIFILFCVFIFLCFYII